MGVTPKLDPMKLTSEQRDKLEAYQDTQKQLQILSDIADISQEMLNVADRAESKNSKQLEALGAVLTDSREQLVKLTNKDAPEAPDYAKPVVEAVSKLERAIKAIKVDPQIKVDAPQVNVAPSSIDLKGIEKILKTDIPKAFKEAISQIPQTEIPEADNSQLLEAWQGISEQLVSIENATRMKPQFPTTLKVTSPDGSSIGGTIWGINDKEDTGTYVYFGFSSADGSWKILRKTIATNVYRYSTGGSNYSTAWTNRASQSYATYDATF